MLVKPLGAMAVLTISVILILYVFVSYFDVKIFKNVYVEHGKRIALLNAIGESSYLIEKDSNDQPKKLIFLSEKLDNMDKNKELSCCYYYDYDYFLEIRDFKNKNKWEIGFDDLDYFLKKGKECEMVSKKKYIGASSIPAIIFDENNYNPGVAIIKLGQTPLSNIAYSISLQCSKYSDYELKTKVYGIKSIDIFDYEDNKEVCIKYEKDSIEKEFCKKIFCNKKITKELTDLENEDGCYEITINYLENEDEIKIYYPRGINLDINKQSESGEEIAI